MNKRKAVEIPEELMEELRILKESDSAKSEEKPKVISGYYRWDTKSIVLKPYRLSWTRLRKRNMNEFASGTFEAKLPSRKISFIGMEVIVNRLPAELDGLYVKRTYETVDWYKFYTEQIDAASDNKSKKRSYKKAARPIGEEKCGCGLNRRMERILRLELVQAGVEDEYQNVVKLLSECADMGSLRREIYLMYPHPEMLSQLMLDTICTACGKYISSPFRASDMPLKGTNLPDKLKTMLCEISERLQETVSCADDVCAVVTALADSKNSKAFRTKLKNMYGEEKAAEICGSMNKEFNEFIKAYSLK